MKLLRNTLDWMVLGALGKIKALALLKAKRNSSLARSFGTFYQILF